jgi:hypothetical protein
MPTVTRNAPRTIAAINFLTVEPSFREDIHVCVPRSPISSGFVLQADSSPHRDLKEL